MARRQQLGVQGRLALRQKSEIQIEKGGSLPATTHTVILSQYVTESLVAVVGDQKFVFQKG